MTPPLSSIPLSLALHFSHILFFLLQCPSYFCSFLKFYSRFFFFALMSQFLIYVCIYMPYVDHFTFSIFILKWFIYIYLQQYYGSLLLQLTAGSLCHSDHLYFCLDLSISLSIYIFLYPVHLNWSTQTTPDPLESGCAPGFLLQWSFSEPLSHLACFVALIVQRCLWLHATFVSVHNGHTHSQTLPIVFVSSKRVEDSTLNIKYIKQMAKCFFESFLFFGWVGG